MRSRCIHLGWLALLALPGMAGGQEGRACYAPQGPLQSIERACSDVIAMLGGAPALTPAERTALIAAYNNRAIERTRNGELELAAEDLSAAVLLAPDRWALYINRGNLRLAQQDYTAALSDYQAAADASADAATLARRNAVIAYRGLGDLAAAEATLTRVIAEAQTATPVTGADRGARDGRALSPALEGTPAGPGSRSR